MRSKLLSVLVGLLIMTCSFAQQMLDVVHLKNGGQVRGTIIEQVPGVSIKVQTSDGSIFVYQMSEVEKLTKEAAPQQKGYFQNDSAQDIDPNGVLEWRDGKLYLEEELISDKTAKQLMGNALWDRYKELNEKWKENITFIELSSGLSAVGLGFLVWGAIAKNDTMLWVAVAGLGAGLISFIPSAIALDNSKKKVQAIVSEYNYGSGLSFKPSFMTMSVPENNLAFNPSSLLPGYSTLFSFSIPF